MTALPVAPPARLVIAERGGTQFRTPRRRSFLCVDTHELGEEIVASYLYQFHLYHWLDTNGYGRRISEDDL